MDRPTRRESRLSLSGVMVLILVILGTGAAAFTVMTMSTRNRSASITWLETPTESTNSRGSQPERTNDAFSAERTAEATPIVYIDSSWGVAAPTSKAPAGQTLAGVQDSPTSIPLPTDRDPFIQAATDIVSTVTQEMFDLTATASGIFAIPSPTPVPMAGASHATETATIIPPPTDPDPLIQAATDIVATVTQEYIDLTSTASGIFAVLSPTPVPNGILPAAGAEIPQNWLTIGVPMALIKSTDGRVVQGGVVRLVNAADDAVIAPLAVVVDQQEDVSGTFSQLYFAIPGEEAQVLVRVVSASAPIRIEVLSENGLVPVIVANQQIPAGTTLTAGMLIESFYPVEAVPPSYQSVDEGVGRVARYDTAAGAPVINGFLEPGARFTVSPPSEGSCNASLFNVDELTLHTEPIITSSEVLTINSETPVEVVGVETDSQGSMWYQVNVSRNMALITGWIPVSDVVVAVGSACPPQITGRLQPLFPTLEPTVTPFGQSAIAEANTQCILMPASEAGVDLMIRPAASAKTSVDAIPNDMQLVLLEAQRGTEDSLTWYRVESLYGGGTAGWVRGGDTIALTPEQCPNLGDQTVIVRHTVAVGETSVDIAARYGVPVETLLKANNLTDSNLNRVTVGTKLIVPMAQLPGSLPNRLPTNADPLIQAATDIVATATQEIIDATATQAFINGTLPPTFTATPSLIPTIPFEVVTTTPTLTATATPIFTATSEVLCRLVAVNADGLVVRARATINSARIGIIPANTSVDVIEQTRGNDDDNIWYHVQVTVDESEIFGWVRADGAVPQTGETCPELPTAVAPLTVTPEPTFTPVMSNMAASVPFGWTQLVLPLNQFDLQAISGRQFPLPDSVLRITDDDTLLSGTALMVNYLYSSTDENELTGLIVAVSPSEVAAISEILASAGGMELEVLSDDRTVPVVFAKEAISAGTTLTFSMLETRYVPLEEVPANFIYNYQEALGRFSRVDIAQGASLMVDALAEPSQNNTRSAEPSQTAVLPEGWRAFSIPMSQFVPRTETEEEPLLTAGGVIRLMRGEGNEVLAETALVLDVIRVQDDFVLSVAAPAQEAVQVVGALEAQLSLSMKILSDDGTAPVVVARQDIPAGTTLTFEMLETAYYPVDALPVPYYRDFKETLGKITTVDTAKGDPIVNDDPTAAGRMGGPIIPIYNTPTATTVGDIAIIITVTPPATTTATLTPSATLMATEPAPDGTATPTLMAEATAIEANSTAVPLGEVGCVLINRETGGLPLYRNAVIGSPSLGMIPSATPMELLDRRIGITGHELWYSVRTQVDGTDIEGWVDSSGTIPQIGYESICPYLPAPTIGLYSYHYVEAGETLADIAAYHEVDLDALITLNEFIVDQPLAVGQLVFIPDHLPSPFWITPTPVSGEDIIPVGTTTPLPTPTP